MAKYRIDLIMNMGRNGWSEVYWKEASTLASAGTAALNLATIRTKLCNVNASVDGWRITPYTDAGLPSGRAQVQAAGPFGIEGAQNAARDNAVAAVLVQWGSTGGAFKKNLWLRGLPDSSTEFFLNGNPNFTPQFNTVFAQFRDYVVNNNHYVRVFDLSPETNPSRDISTITFDDGGNMRIALAANLTGAFAGLRVKISGYKGRFTSKVNGMAKITSITDAGLTLHLDKVSCEFKDTFGSANGAKVRLERYAFPSITTGAAVRFSKHNTGRAFFVAPGRRVDKNRCRITRVVGPSIT